MEQIQTKRLILRSWTESDAEDLYRYASSDKVGPMAGWKPHGNIEESRYIIRMFIRDGTVWALLEKESGRVIGSIGLHDSSPKGDIVYDRELGYVLAEEKWGQGLMPEAVRAVIGYAFETMRINSLAVSHSPFNRQSQKVIEKSGFRYQKRIEKSWKRFDGETLDEEVYLMTADDYAEQKKKGFFCR